MNTPYELLGGEEGVRALCDAFYQAMDEMPQTEKIRRMHKENLDDIKEKLFEYLSGWMGGPNLYADKYGTVCMTDPHKPFAIGPKERDQWLACMDEALERVNASDEVKEMLKVPMFRIADAVKNRDKSEDPNPDIIALG